MASVKKRLVYARINIVIAEKSKAGVLIENSIITSIPNNTTKIQSTKEIKVKKLFKHRLFKHIYMFILFLYLYYLYLFSQIEYNAFTSFSFTVLTAQFMM